MSDKEKQTRLSAKQVQEDLTEKLDSVVESTNDAIDGLKETVSELDGKMDAILNAINNPVVPRKHTEADEQDLGATAEIDEGIIENGRFGDTGHPEFQEKAAGLAFMNEPVTVAIHDSSGQHDDKVFDVSVNGRAVTFVRGQEYVVQRKFVEGLARAKPVHYDNQEYVDNDGVRKVRHPSRKGLRYPFAVVKDDNPLGRQWLKTILAQP